MDMLLGILINNNVIIYYEIICYLYSFKANGKCYQV